MRKRCLSGLFTFLVTVSLIASVSASSTNSFVSAEYALQMLIDGNKRFLLEEYSPHQKGQARRSELTNGQHPFAVIVSCSDSRVPPELLFDQGLGNLFVIRVAGNVLDSIELGSVEYAVEHLGTKLIVILGHENCGAVKAALDDGEHPLPPHIKAITTKLQPAVAAAKAANTANIYETAADTNIVNMAAIVKADPVISRIDGIKVVGAKYYLASGKIEFLHD